MPYTLTCDRCGRQEDYKYLDRWSDFKVKTRAGANAGWLLCLECSRAANAWLATKADPCPAQHDDGWRCQRLEGHAGQHIYTSETDGRSVSW